MFMTTVCTAFIFVSDNAFGLEPMVGYVVAITVFILSGLLFAAWLAKYKKSIKE